MVSVLDISELRKLLVAAEKLKGDEKLGAMKKLHHQIQLTEYAYSLDFSMPYGALTEIRELLPSVEGSINRLEAAKMRKELKEDAKNGK